MFKEGHMCSTCFTLGVIAIYSVKHFVFVTIVASRSRGESGIEWKWY